MTKGEALEICREFISEIPDEMSWIIVGDAGESTKTMGRDYVLSVIEEANDE